MAWALQFDGVNDYVSIGSPVYLPENCDLNITVAWNAIDSNYEMLVGTWDTGGTEWYFGKKNSSDGTLRLYGRSGALTSDSPSGTIVAGEYLSLTIERRGSQLRVLNDGVEVCPALTMDNLSSAPIKVFCKSNDGNSYHADVTVQKFELIDIDTSILNKWDATASSHTAGTAELVDTVGGNNATGFNMPTDGSAWIDLGGSGVTVTAATANYNYAGVTGTIDLTGEVIVTGQTANYDYAAITASIELGSEIIVTGQTANYNYTGINGSIELTGLITVTGQTANYDYDGIAADITLQGSVIVTASTANYDYNALNGTIILQGPITINPKNIIRVKRKSNTIRIKRKSNTIIVR